MIKIANTSQARAELSLCDLYRRELAAAGGFGDKISCSVQNCFGMLMAVMCVDLETSGHQQNDA